MLVVGAPLHADRLIVINQPVRFAEDSMLTVAGIVASQSREQAVQRVESGAIGVWEAFPAVLIEAFEEKRYKMLAIIAV